MEIFNMMLGGHKNDCEVLRLDHFSQQEKQEGNFVIFGKGEKSHLFQKRRRKKPFFNESRLTFHSNHNICMEKKKETSRSALILISVSRRTKVGSFKSALANSTKAFGKVAENNTVWRASGSFAEISAIWGANPVSKSLKVLLFQLLVV